jgi:hypothetical protein
MNYDMKATDKAMNDIAGKAQIPEVLCISTLTDRQKSCSTILREII